MSIRRLLIAVFLFTAVAFANSEPLGVTSQDGVTTVRVWAPNARSVAVIGDFNNWKAMQGDHLVKDESSGIWSVNLRRSRPRGAYQFLINGNLARRDPYARAVSPDETKSLFYDPNSFPWGDDRHPGHALEDTIIYEMHIGTFHDPKPNDRIQATFDDAIRRLDYLVELGVNTLCLLPIHEFNGNHSWGYNPSDLFAVEQAYGGPEAFKRFVKACHARGLAVHLDIVHNHYGPQNLDLLQFDGTGNRKNGGIYFYEGDGIGMTPWGPRVKFDSPMVRRFVRDNVMMWLDEYRIDGFRWDSTINIRAWDNGAHPIPAGAKMLEDINNEIKQLHPGKWSIAEDSMDMGNFHGSWDYDFHHYVMPALAAKSDHDRDMYRVASALRRPFSMWRVVYVDNHDEAGKLNGQFRIATDADPTNPGGDHARRMCGLGALLTFTAPGIPLLFMGNEFQEYGTFHEDQPLDWSKTRKHAGMLTLHRDLIALRKNTQGHSIGLKGRGIRIQETDNQAKRLVYWRSHESRPSDIVVVAVNFSSQPTELVIPFPSPGPWLLRLDTENAAYGGTARADTPRPFRLDAQGHQALTALPPYSARIYSLVERPVAGAVTAPKPAPAPIKHDRPPLSMYASINLVGSFNDWKLTAWPFQLLEDYVWEGRFVFENVNDPSFKISANDNGIIHWGGQTKKSEARQDGEIKLKRLGENLAAPGLWDGAFRFVFYEEELRLVIEPTNMPEPEPATPAFRSWTDARGATMEAKLVDATNKDVTLERTDGRSITLPLERLSYPDRDYVREWLRNRN
ncbi:MAG TPA: alpha-amylase family glycosyl hydrolase [Kiritimatiellia bacterium]|nr:alpha-amylase family glycosyl hydrolase [Kiritimatiellia bacterium]